MPRENPPGPVTPEFLAASNIKFNSHPTNEEKLDMYAHYKVGGGYDLATAEPVGTFQFEEKAKRRAWQALVDTGISAEDAQKKYVEIVEGFKAKYGVQS
ncbi:hypothetical protein P152DRAFT_473060 [Eremomyces bilateralis CBS 781.70]|uniref:ACB domain-containing protein n=1 Tax=Eremomyces bilateralis CBS 781.70 TaxID=1392243 RepID=A0A6G1G5N2_9PEZI|nr:uncharacterized protein P152DRAFT_473060 [Eremomyces bilateralis CBS 781.70]KAF1813328.1 hypothetical protein P152DRAFT_473060 [Eremomyces bilateralis CBS 781.70]